MAKTRRRHAGLKNATLKAEAQILKFMKEQKKAQKKEETQILKDVRAQKKEERKKLKDNRTRKKKEKA